MKTLKLKLGFMEGISSSYNNLIVSQGIISKFQIIPEYSLFEQN